VPTPLTNTSVNTNLGREIHLFDFSFSVPWSEIEMEKDSKAVSLLRFKNGPSLIVFNPSSELNAVGAVRGQNSEQNRTAQRLLGAETLSSNYDFMAAELAMTPDQNKWWDRTASARCMVLLGMKAATIGGSKVIHRISNNELRGFQFGDQFVAPDRVTLNLFDVNNRRYELVISDKSDPQRHLEQADINAIIASLRPIPHS
jgi:hypothetical protein